MREKQRFIVQAFTSLLGASLAVGCNDGMYGDVSPPTAGPSVSGVGGGAGALGITDTRPVVKSAAPPPPIIGGTLLALSDGERALASDPDRDRIWLLDYGSSRVTGAITLEAGAQPTRAVEDDAGHAYVVLRGTGDLLTIDLATASIAERRHVCIAPRGVSLSANRDRVLVSCAEGRLVDMPFSGVGQGETPIPADARDVVVQGGRVLVSRFRAAELVEVAADGPHTTPLPSVPASVTGPIAFPGSSELEASVAWRTAVGPSGDSIVVVHQRATTVDIQLPPPNDPSEPAPTTEPAGKPGLPGGDSTYGGDFSGCGGIVQSAITLVQDGVTLTSPQLAGVVLPVDVAVSEDGYIAVAGAGSADLLNVKFSASSDHGVVFFTVPLLDRNTQGDCVSGIQVSGLSGEQIVSVAFEPGTNGRALALARDPLRLFVVDGFRTSGFGFVTSAFDIHSVNVSDTGHDIFHRDAGGGIACASCHPEGTDDGRTWNFAPIGARRTQPLDVGLEGSAPFHWDGDLPTIGSLMSEVFVRRMGGFAESPERIDAIQNWIFSLHPRAALRAADDPAAQRGKALFNSGEVGCATCHAGSKFTNSTSFDVGTGGKFQVPSLLGVARRLPVMHTGCATTLRERFDATCGGTAHGNTAQLDEGQLSDLVSYLESI